MSERTLYVIAIIAFTCIGVFAAEPAELWKVTAYCPCSKCCGDWADGITASGKPVTANETKFVAAPRGLPFDTLLVIPGYNNGSPVPVLDRGGAIKGKRIDVYFPTHQEALEWGVQYLPVEKWEPITIVGSPGTTTEVVEAANIEPACDCICSGDWETTVPWQLSLTSLCVGLAGWALLLFKTYLFDRAPEFVGHLLNLICAILVLIGGMHLFALL